MSRQPLPWLATGFGALMVAAAAQPGGVWGIVVPGLAAGALVVALFVRPAATVAVALSIVAIALGEPTPLFAAVSGLAAAAYLVTRYADGSAAVTLTVPTVLGMVGFTLAGVAATAVGVRLTWIPLFAPAIAAAILVVVARPLLAGVFSSRAAGEDASG